MFHTWFNTFFLEVEHRCSASHPCDMQNKSAALQPSLLRLNSSPNRPPTPVNLFAGREDSKVKSEGNSANNLVSGWHEDKGKDSSALRSGMAPNGSKLEGKLFVKQHQQRGVSTRKTVDDGVGRTVPPAVLISSKPLPTQCMQQGSTSTYPPPGHKTAPATHRDHSHEETQKPLLRSQFSCRQCYDQTSCSEKGHGTCYRVLELSKREIDKANKDKQHKIYPPHFKVGLSFHILTISATAIFTLESPLFPFKTQKDLQGIVKTTGEPFLLSSKTMPC